MKRILSVVAAVAMTFCALWLSGSAAQIDPQRSALFQPEALYTVRTGENFTVRVNPFLIAYSDGTGTWSTDAADLALSVAVSDPLSKSLGISMNSSNGAQWFAPYTLKSESALTFWVNAGDKHPYELRKGTVDVTATTIKQTQTQTQTSSFQVEILPENGSLRDFSGVVPSVAQTVATGSPITIPVQDSWFSYYGQDETKNTVSLQKLRDYGVDLSVVNNAPGVTFTASLEEQYGAPVIRLTAYGNPIEGAYYRPVITMSGANYTLSGKSVSFIPQIQFDVASQGVVEGLSGTGTAPEYQGVVPGTVVVGDSLDFAVPDDNFVLQNGSDAAQTLALFNSNAGAWIQLSPELDKLVDKSFIQLGTARTAGGTAQFGVRLTPRMTGTIPVGSTLAVGGASYTFTNAVQIQAQAASLSGNKITGIASGAWLGWNATKNSRPMTGGESVEGLDIRPGDTVQLWLDSDFFTWENGSPDPVVAVDRASLSAGRITVRMSGKSNSKVVDKVSIATASGRAYILVEFADKFVSTSEKSFEFTVSLYQNGTRHRDSETTLSGTIENEVVYVDSGDDYVDLSDGLVAEAEEHIRSIDVYLGEGVTVRARMYKGKKYYGYAQQNPSNYDDRLMDEYRDLETVYSLHTVGLNSSSNRVSIDASRKYYVFNGEFEYQGTTHERLAYSSKYYLTTDRDLFAGLNGEAEEIPGAADGDDYTGNGSASSSGEGTGTGTGTTTGSGSGSLTANSNPPNGRGKFPLGSTVTGALLVLAAALLLVGKRRPMEQA